MIDDVGRAEALVKKILGGIVIQHCNSISGSGTHSCEREKGHEGKCVAESFRGGYVFWAKPEGYDDPPMALDPELEES